MATQVGIVGVNAQMRAFDAASLFAAARLVPAAELSLSTPRSPLGSAAMTATLALTTCRA